MHGSLRIYSLCKMMKWAHLPVAGGIYAQSPKLLDDFLVIAAAEGKATQERLELQERKTREGLRARR